MRIEVFSDVVCPWCYIGTRRLSRAVDAVVAEGLPAPVVEMRPFQLDPGAPSTPSPVTVAYAARFGDRAPEILGRVTDAAREDGLALRFDLAQRANTRLAHILLDHALSTAGHAAQWSLSNLLFRAYFEEGADLGDPDLLVSVAERAGVDGATAAIATNGAGLATGGERLAQALERAAELGITAVPTFVVDGRWSIPGAQDTDTFARIIRRLSA